MRLVTHTLNRVSTKPGQVRTVTSCQYSMSEGNEVAVLFEIDDLDTYMRVLESPATAEAMAFDGINRETVKVFVLDKQFTP